MELPDIKHLSPEDQELLIQSQQKILSEGDEKGFIAIEPFADDLASFGLDLLVRKKGFRRAAANPLMVVL